jgi:hypothetical protein
MNTAQFRIRTVNRLACLVLATCLTAPAVHGQVVPIFTNNFSQNPQPFPVPVTGYPDGTGAAFGSALAALGGGRFAVSLPQVDVLKGILLAPQGFVVDGGFVYTYDQTNQYRGARTCLLYTSDAADDM